MAKNKVSEWSSTPANNTDIGNINIAEGCAPSGINNAIRELMSQVKDMQSGTDGDNFTIGGNLSVTGTATLSADPTTNLQAATKSYVDTAADAAQSTAISTAVANAGTAADAKYVRYDASQSLNTTQKTTAQDNLGLANMFVPSGAVMHFARNTAPTGWLAADGSAVSRTTYAALFSAIGTTFGSGDGSTTFNLPDLRGEFIRGVDGGRGVDSGRAFGSFQDATGVPNYVTFSGVWPLSISVANSDGTLSTFGDGSSGGGGISGYGGNGSWTTSRLKTRPRNVALLACVKV